MVLGRKRDPKTLNLNDALECCDGRNRINKMITFLRMNEISIFIWWLIGMHE